MCVGSVLIQAIYCDSIQAEATNYKLQVYTAFTVFSGTIHWIKSPVSTNMNCHNMKLCVNDCSTFHCSKSGRYKPGNIVFVLNTLSLKKLVLNGLLLKWPRNSVTLTFRSYKTVKRSFLTLKIFWHNQPTTRI